MEGGDGARAVEGVGREGGGVEVGAEDGVERGGVRGEVGAEGHPGGLVAGGGECDGGGCGGRDDGYWWEGGAQVRGAGRRRLEVHGVSEGVLCGDFGYFVGLGDVGVERCWKRAKTVLYIEL